MERPPPVALQHPCTRNSPGLWDLPCHSKAGVPDDSIKRNEQLSEHLTSITPDQSLGEEGQMARGPVAVCNTKSDVAQHLVFTWVIRQSCSVCFSFPGALLLHSNNSFRHTLTSHSPPARICTWCTFDYSEARGRKK